MRSDGGAAASLQSDRTDTIIVGRPGSLQTFTVPGEGIIGGLTFVGADLAFLYLRQVGADALVGIDRLDVATGTVTPLVAATPAAEWIGITGFCDAAPLGASCGLFTVVGCGPSEPPCPDGSAPPCLILYGKVDANDTDDDRRLCLRCRRRRQHAPGRSEHRHLVLVARTSPGGVGEHVGR